MNEEQAVKTLNKIKDRSMLTDIEVDLSNLIIKNKKIIQEQQQKIDKAIELLNTYITNEKSNIKSDYYLIDMFQKLLSILRGEE